MSADKELESTEPIRELLFEAFMPDELYRFCRERDDFRPVTRKIRRDYSLSSMVDELLTYCETRNLLKDLRDEVKKVYPRVYEQWEEEYFPKKPVPGLSGCLRLVITVVVLFLAAVGLLSLLEEGEPAESRSRSSGIEMLSGGFQRNSGRLFTVVYTGRDGVSVRKGPDIHEAELRIVAVDTILEATGEREIDRDGRVWWGVYISDGRGWVAEFNVQASGKVRLLVPVTTVGSEVEVAVDPVDLWDTTRCVAMHRVRKGEILDVIDGPGSSCKPELDSRMKSETRQWWKVRSQDGKEGWVAEFDDNKNLLIVPTWYGEVVRAVDEEVYASAIEAIRTYYVLLAQKKYEEAWKMAGLYTQQQHNADFEYYKRYWRQKWPTTVEGDVEVVSSGGSSVELKVVLNYPSVQETYCYKLQQDYERGDSQFDYWIFVTGRSC